MKFKGTLAIAGAAFAADQVTKIAVVHALDLKTRLTIDVWPPFFNLVMAWNRGANFGLGDTLGQWFWIAVAIAISAGLLYWSMRLKDIVRLACIGLLVGGAIGNAVDRVVYGAVADFLNMSCCGIRNPYAFNLADVLIFLGAAGLILREGSDKQTTKA
jgi:signal peptidase II